jgi:hypothetical protein
MKIYPFKKLTTVTSGQLVATPSVTGKYDISHDTNYDVFQIECIIDDMALVNNTLYYPDELREIQLN